MNKNIMRMIVCTLVPFNLAMSMDNSGEEHGCKRVRSNTIGEPQLKFKGFYPALDASGDIFSRVPLNKFFMHFNPGKDPNRTAEELMKSGVSTNSTPEEVNGKYKSYLNRSIMNQNEDPANYAAEIAATCSHFKDVYKSTIKPIIENAEARDAESCHSDSEDVFVHMTSEEFFIRFDPRVEAEELAKELVRLGVTTLSTQEDVNKVFRSCVEYQLDVDCGEYVSDYVNDVDKIVKFFNEKYEGIVMPYIGIIEKDTVRTR